jgi:DNA polymerase-4
VSARPQARLPWRKPVGFAEVPDFHVAVARHRAPELRDRSLVVGGEPSKRGKVLALSPELRAQGLVEGMLMEEALRRQPAVHWVRTDMRRARELSGRLRAAVRREVDAVETEGLGGFYLEAPEAPAEALALARRLSARVEREIGLLLRVGVAPACFAARWAAEDAGDAGACVIDRSEFDAYLLRQPIERLPGVGPKTMTRLAELGVVDIPGLRALGSERLGVLLGPHGATLWQLACGEDPRPLRLKRHPESLSRELTFGRKTQDDPRKLGSGLERLAENLEAALRRDGLKAGRIALRVTGPDARTVTRSRVLDPPVAEAQPFLAAAQALLERTGLPPHSVRKAGLVVAGLELSGAEDRQLELF